MMRGGIIVVALVVAASAASVDNVSSPKDGDALYYGKEYAVMFKVTDVNEVRVRLYRQTESRDVFVRDLAPFPYKVPTDAEKFNFTVPRSVPAGEGYYISVLAADFGKKVKTPRSSGTFSIGEEQLGPCKPGTRSDDGVHPCTPCLLGTYWVDAKTCAPCPDGLTTEDHFAKSDKECVPRQPSALSLFNKTSCRYLKSSNDVIHIIDDHDHVSLEQCAQICLDDAGCKSFDGGADDVANPFQIGDCFASYDNEGTIQPGGWGFVEPWCQLTYFKRKNVESILDTLFTKKETCFIEGNDDAGKFDHEVLGSGDNVYRTGHSPEACAQLCLKDPRCKSFDAGRRDNANRIDYCYLSYKNEADVKAESPDLFVCDVSQGWDYFEKIPELLDESTRCRPGYISQSGHDLARSPCAKCRANTYSSDAGTRCTRCPLGKISMSGSGKIQDCFFPDASITSSTGALRLGSQWIGTYSTVITENGADRVAGGRAMIEVVSVSGFNVRILASLSHGEFCDKAGTAGQFSRECRVAGFSEFYLDGVYNPEEETLSTQLFLPTTGQLGWVGITDRSFNREAFQGKVQVNGENTVLSGVYGRGTFSVTERCRASTEVGTFTPGDRFVGTYGCDRRYPTGREAKEGEEDIRRMDLYINELDRDTGVVTAVVDFDHAFGVGEYVVSGKYDGESRSVKFSPGINAWITQRPEAEQAKALVGRLSVDGEYFNGQVTTPAACRCVSPEELPSTNANEKTGSSCEVWDEHERVFPWCYVSHECPEAIEEPSAPGHYYADCSANKKCNEFSLVRVCSEAATLCPAGWQKHNSRCYKVEANTADSYAAAQQQCAQQKGELTSIHGYDENVFVQQLLKQTGAPQAWIGLSDVGGKEVWEDESLYTYQHWAADEPKEEPCATMTGDGTWAVETCDKPLAYVCKAVPLARAQSCECSGESDRYSLGGSCKHWTKDNPNAWCYTTENCPRGAPIQEKDATGVEVTFWRTICYEGSGATTPAMTTREAFTTTQPETDLKCHENDPATFQEGGQCKACTRRCQGSEYLAGACEAYSQPACLPCHPSCATCTGPQDSQCTLCAAGLTRTVAGMCKSACEEYEFEAGGVCYPCAITCATCDGPEFTDCTSCDRGGSLFLDGVTGACSNECPRNYVKDSPSQACLACEPCADDEWEVQGCQAGGIPRTCEKITKCRPVSEFELRAPTTTSDRLCKTVASCRVGMYEDVPPTATSNRVCSYCEAGTTDDDRNWRTPCTECGGGVYLPKRSIYNREEADYGRGPCSDFLCPAGTADTDSDPLTECVACVAGESFQDEAGQTACKPANQCAAGTEPSKDATTTADIECRSCVPGVSYKPSSDNTACLPQPVCKAGQEETSPAAVDRMRVCTDCKAGFFIDSTLRSCKAWTTCPPGQEEDQSSPPSRSSDRKCVPCDDGFFSTGNGARCRPWAVCAGDQYETSPPAPGSDRECAAATSCQADEYVVSPPKGGSDRVCAKSPECSEGVTFNSAVTSTDEYGNNLVPAKCTPCSTCPNGNPGFACTVTRDTVCAECGQPCVPGVTFEVQPCTVTDKIRCQGCARCGADQYLRTPCSGGTDSDCRPVRECLPTEIEINKPTASSDRECVAKRACIPGEFVNPSPTSIDDVCKPCPEGFFSLVSDAPNCTRHSVCKAAEGLLSAGSATVDTQCTSCILGDSFKPLAGNAPCTPTNKESCTAGTKQVEATLTADRTCVPCAEGTYQEKEGQNFCADQPTCSPGNYIATPGSASSKRVCAACPPSSYQDAENQQSCVPWARCGPGKQGTVGSSVTDVACQSCPDGLFKEATDAAPGSLDKCQPWSTCSRGREPGSFTPSPTDDRSCELCGPGYYQPDADSTAKCRRATSCRTGEYVKNDVPANRDVDRECSRCPPFSFSSTLNQAECTPWQVCPAGQSGVPGSNVKDVRCIPCKKGFFKAAADPRPGKLNKCQRWSTCGAGERIDPESPPSATEDRGCIRCPPETFSATGNTINCSRAYTCQPGAFVKRDLPDSRDANRVCEPCAKGTFSDRQNAMECTPFSTPPLGQYGVGGSSTEDWTFSSCDSYDGPTLPEACIAAAGSSASKSGSSGTAAVAGGVVGGLVALALIIAAVVLFARRSGVSVPAGKVHYTVDATDGDGTASGHASFVNPLYDVNTAGVPRPSETIYDRVDPSIPEALEESGYLDVQKMPLSESGYMDVQPIPLEEDV